MLIAGEAGPVEAKPACHRHPARNFTSVRSPSAMSSCGLSPSGAPDQREPRHAGRTRVDGAPLSSRSGAPPLARARSPRRRRRSSRQQPAGDCGRAMPRRLLVGSLGRGASPPSLGRASTRTGRGRPATRRMRSLLRPSRVALTAGRHAPPARSTPHGAGAASPAGGRQLRNRTV